MDVVNDAEGRHVGVLEVNKLTMLAGECDMAETIDEERLTELGSRIGSHLSHLGVLDADIIDKMVFCTCWT